MIFKRSLYLFFRTDGCRKRIVILFFLLVYSSCDYSGINEDVNKVYNPDPDALMAYAIAQSAYNQAAVPMRMASLLMQYWTFNEAWLWVLRYNLDPHTLDNYWKDGVYSGNLKASVEMLKISEQEKLFFHSSVARILIARELGTLTSMVGDIPWSEAINGAENMFPSYDPQEEIYRTVQDLLDQAIVDLEKSTPEFIGADLIFQGKPENWIRTARALKMRYYLHLMRRDQEAPEKILEIAREGAINSNMEQPDFHFIDNFDHANPVAKFGAERPNTLIIDPRFYQKMNERSDPRTGKYMLVYDEYAIYFYSPGDSLFWSEYDSPIPLISYSECRFIEAEALLRVGNSAEAEITLKEAVGSNMDYLGIPENKKAEYIKRYANFNNLLTFEEKLNRIIEEKYYSLYIQGPFEIWTDYRRTGYPEIVPDTSISSINPSGVIPRRCVYPESEYQYNFANLQAALERQNLNFIDQDLWAFK